MTEKGPSIIVGLGNPGKSYERTRHNIGFLVADRFSEKHSLNFREKSKFKGELAEGSFEGNAISVLKPKTYMNLSGESLALYSRFLKVSPSMILVVVDDVDLPFGKIRLKVNSGPGTHNGLRSIENHLHTNRYARLRIGVGQPEESSLADFVLSKFSLEEEKLLPEIIEKSVEAIEKWLVDGVNRAMEFANRIHLSNPSNGEK